MKRKRKKEMIETAESNKELVITEQEEAQIRTDGQLALERAQEFVIQDAHDWRNACQHRLGIRSALKRLDEKFYGTEKDPGPQTLAWRTFRKIADLHKEAAANANDALEILTAKIDAWEEEREKLGAADQQRARDEAYSKALIKQADDAAKLAAQGDAEGAARVLTAKLKPEPIVMASPIPEMEGQSRREVWEWRLVDDGETVSREFLRPDEEKINALVKRLGRVAEDIVGGIEVFSKKITVLRPK